MHQLDRRVDLGNIDHASSSEARYQQLSIGGGLSALAARKHEKVRLVFVRGRLADPNNLTPAENHFSYPPAAVCSQYGRANIPHHPVLYAGESPAVIAEELQIPENSWFHLAVYYTPAPVDFEYLILLHDALSSENKWSQIRDELREHVMGLQNMPMPFDAVWARLQQAALLFRGKDYADTAAIAHHWLYTQNLDAILYPSVRNDRWCNFAIHPRFADGLRQHCVVTCRKKGVGEMFEVIHTGRLDDVGQLQWLPTSHEDLEQLEMGFTHLTQAPLQTPTNRLPIA